MYIVENAVTLIGPEFLAFRREDLEIDWVECNFLHGVELFVIVHQQSEDNIILRFSRYILPNLSNISDASFACCVPFL